MSDDGFRAGTPVGHDAYEILADIPFAAADPEGSKGHLLDLYLPLEPNHPARPLLLITGGNGWLEDDGKYYAAEIGPYFAECGLVVAGVSTRASTQARFPAQLHDLKAAIRWLRRNASRYGIDPGRVAVLGESSGGWIAAMVGVTGDVAELEGQVGVTGCSSRLQAVVTLYPPTDFLQLDERMLPGALDFYNARFGLADGHNDPASPQSLLMGFPIQSRPEETGRANPLNYVSRDSPPFLLVHGQEDAYVPPHQSQLLFDALEAAGVPAVLFSVPGIGHNKAIISPDGPAAEVRITARAAGMAAVSAAPRPTPATIAAFLLAAFGFSEPA